MKTALLSFILLISGTLQASSHPLWKEIPADFRGDWALRGSTCSTGPSDSGNIRITGKAIIMFESRNQVKQVKIIDSSMIEVRGRTTHYQTSYGSIELLSLSADKNSLIISPNADPDFYTRCSK
jgi:hypothetical protein